MCTPTSGPLIVLVLALAMSASSENEMHGVRAEQTDEGSYHPTGHGPGLSYQKFSGPVSGGITSIQVPAGADGKGPRVDYYAAPDYSYSYGVKDPATGNTQEHQESRHGDAVHGQYSVLQADGAMRVVKYTADPQNGFQAVVEYHELHSIRK